MDQEEDLSKLSLEARLSHKNWKARSDAYEELCKLFARTASEQDPAFRPYLTDDTLLKKIVTDANAVAQEKGIDAISALIKYAGPNATKTRPGVMPSLIGKGLSSVRAGTKNKSVEAILLYIEVSEPGPTVDDLILALDAKQPKLVAAVVFTLKETFRLYGARTVNPKSVLKTLSKIFAHTDKNVRAEGTDLAKVLYLWLGNAIQPYLADLKPVQQKELAESFALLDGEKPAQTRFLRTQQAQQQSSSQTAVTHSASSASQSLALAQEEDAPVDAFELAEPVEIMKMMPADFYDSLESPKWKDRKDALSAFLVIVQTPKIADSQDYSTLVRSLGKRVSSDANILCVIVAANILEALAHGLRNAFSSYKSISVPALLDRLKERKQSVVDALAKALDVIASTTSLSELLDDFLQGAKNKNPQVKAETFKWLARALYTSKKPPQRAETKALAESAISGMDDSVGDVRDSAAKALGALCKRVGDRALAPFIEPLDEIRKAKVAEAAASNDGTGGNDAAPASTLSSIAPSSTNHVPARLGPATVQHRASPTKTPLPLRKAQTSQTMNIPPPSPIPTNSTPKSFAPIAKKPFVKNHSGAQSSLAPKTGPIIDRKLKKGAADEPLKYKYSAEEADALAETSIPETIRTGISSTNWKERLEAVEALQSGITQRQLNNLDPELVTRYTFTKVGVKESNFQVLGKTLALYTSFAKDSPAFNKACASIMIPLLCDKLGDLKLKKAASDALNESAEKLTLGYILSSACPLMVKQKAPKVQADSVAWVQQAITDFGIKGVAVKELIEFVKSMLKSTNGLVRSSATSCLTTLRIYLGQDILALVQDLNPTLLTTISAEFEKVADQSAPAPVRGLPPMLSDSEDVSHSSTTAEPSQRTGTSLIPFGTRAVEQAAPSLDDLLPRTDISDLITSSMIAQCGDASWKVRKETMDGITTILERNRKIEPYYGDYVACLKSRTADANISVKLTALDHIIRLANAMDSSFKTNAKALTSSVAAVCSDQKAPVRQAAVNTLDVMCNASGLEPMIPALGASAASPNPALRASLLAWLGTRLTEHTFNDEDLSPLGPPIINSLEDRNGEVRKAASTCLPHLITNIGYQATMDLCSGLKGSSKVVIIPQIEAARQSQQSIVSQPRDQPRMTAKVHQSQIIPKEELQSPSRPALNSGIAATATRRPPTAATLPAPGKANVKPRVSSYGQSVRSVPTATNTKRQSLTPTATAKVLTEPASREACLLKGDLTTKTHRINRELAANQRWMIDGLPKPDLFEALQQQMSGSFSSTCIQLMFSKDAHREKAFLQALSLLLDFMSVEPLGTNTSSNGEDINQLVVGNADLLLKYVCLRSFDSNTSIHLKSFELIERIISVFDVDGVHLSDAEASYFMPSLINKLGDSKETIRTRVRSILGSLGRVYPSSKVYSLLVEHGVKSKNARTRLECLEEMALLIRDHGVNVSQPSKSMSSVAQCIGDRDGSVRTAALNVISQAYQFLGDGIQRYLGHLSDKDRTLLDERLKRSSGAASPAKLQHRIVSNGSTSSGRITDVLSDGRSPTRQSPIGRVLMPVSQNAVLSSPSSPSKSVTEAPNGRSSFGQHRSVETRNDRVLTLQFLKDTHEVLCGKPEVLARDAEAFLTTVIVLIRDSFQLWPHENDISVQRVCKWLLNLSLEITKTPLIMKDLEAGILQLMINELIRGLVALSGRKDETSVTYFKSINLILLRFLGNARTDVVWSALLQSTTKLARTVIDLPDASEECISSASQVDVLTKCMCRLEKVIPEQLATGTLSVSAILRELENFLQILSPKGWSERKADERPMMDYPYKASRSIVTALCKCLGSTILENLFLIPDGSNSLVHRHISKCLKEQRKILSPINGDNIDPKLPTREDHGKKIAQIMEMTKDRSSNTEGCRQLYDFLASHPEARATVEASLAKEGPLHKTLVLGTLKNIEREGKGGSTASEPQPNGSGQFASAIQSEKAATLVDSRFNHMSAPIRERIAAMNSSTNMSGYAM